MIEQTLHLEKWDWLCKVYYEARPSDASLILSRIERIGCKDKYKYMARKRLQTCSMDTAFTFSNCEERESVIVIMPTSCANSFMNSFEHEKFHLTMHIAKTDGLDVFSEDVAYLNGDISEQMFKIARKFVCDCCRKKS